MDDFKVQSLGNFEEMKFVLGVRGRLKCLKKV